MTYSSLGKHSSKFPQYLIVNYLIINIMFFEKVCEVDRLAIIDQRNEPNLVRGKRGRYNFIRILVFLGDV